MTEFKHDSFSSLPTPAKGRGGAVKLGMLTLAVLLITGTGLYWLSRDEDDKSAIASVVKENVQSAVKDTPLATVVNTYVAPPKPPVRVPKTDPGTLAGQSIQGQMSAPSSSTSQTAAVTSSTDMGISQPIDAASLTSAEPATGAEASSLAPAITPVAPKVTQDQKVPLDFVEDMASWLVQRYNPRKGLSLNLSSANLRYGQKMHTLLPEGSKDVLGARAELLRYAFNSSMMTALYNLYADRFVQGMQKAAATPLQGQKEADPHKVLRTFSAEFSTLGSTLQGIGALVDFTTHMQNIDSSVEDTLRIHEELTEAIFAFDAAVEEKNSDAAATIQLRIDSLNAQYQRSIHNKTLATENLIAAVRKQAPAASHMDAESILFVAQWLDRRIHKGSSDTDIRQSASTAGTLLQNLAEKLQQTPSNTSENASPAQPQS